MKDLIEYVNESILDNIRNRRENRRQQKEETELELAKKLGDMKDRAWSRLENDPKYQADKKKREERFKKFQDSALVNGPGREDYIIVKNYYTTGFPKSTNDLYIRVSEIEKFDYEDILKSLDAKILGKTKNAWYYIQDCKKFDKNPRDSYVKISVDYGAEKIDSKNTVVSYVYKDIIIKLLKKMKPYDVNYYSKLTWEDFKNCFNID